MDFRPHFFALVAVTFGFSAMIGCGDSAKKTEKSPGPAGSNQVGEKPKGNGSSSKKDPPDSANPENNEQGDSATEASQDGDENDNKSLLGQGDVKDPSQAGSYRVLTYTQGLNDTSYASAIVYYPENFPKDSKTVATTLSGGLNNTKEQMAWIGQHLASHGMVVIAFTPTNNRSINASIWATGHKGAFKKVQAEASRQGSPLSGMVDPKRIGIMGFSMGGAGTLLAVDGLQGEAAAAVALCPYQPNPPDAKTPTMFITGTNDNTASPQAVVSAYRETSNDAPKALQNIQGMGHGDINRTTTFRKQLGKSITAWLGLHLVGNEKYREFLNSRDTEVKQ